MKHPVTGMPVDPSINGYIGAGYYGEQYTQQYNQYNQYNQPQQLQQPQQYNYEEYPHYPNPEEYIGDRNRAYYPNGDVYAMTNKSRSRLDSDCKYLFKCVLFLTFNCSSTCWPLILYFKNVSN